MQNLFCWPCRQLYAKMQIVLSLTSKQAKQKTIDCKICQKVSRHPSSERTKCKENVVWNHLHIVRVCRSLYIVGANIPIPALWSLGWSCSHPKTETRHRIILHSGVEIVRHEFRIWFWTMEGKIEIGTKSKQLYDKMRKSHLRGVEKSVHRIKQRNDKTENLILRLDMCAPWKCRKN